MQSIDKYKVVFISLFIEVLTKLVLQYPLMILAYKLNIGAYIGNITATITVIISLLYMKIKMKISLKDSFISTIKITLASIVMYACLMLLNEFIPSTVDGRFKAIIIVIIYAVVGGFIYFLLTYKTLFKRIFGTEAIDKIKRKFKKSNS